MSDNKAIANIQDEIKKQVAALNESLGDKTITIDKNSGKFKVGTNLGDKTVDVVILAFGFSGAFWSKPWSPGQTELPDCSVTGDVDTKYMDTAVPPFVGSFMDLTPRGKDDDTPPQAETCGECPMNIFGSSLTGGGKGCKQSYTLAVLPAGDAAGHIHKVTVSASGMKHFNKYLKDIASAGTTWWANKTTLEVVEAGASWTVKTHSDNVKPLTEKQLQAFYGRVAEAKKMLTTPVASAAEEVAAGAQA